MASVGTKSPTLRPARDSAERLFFQNPHSGQPSVSLGTKRFPVKRTPSPKRHLRQEPIIGLFCGRVSKLRLRFMGIL